MHMFEACGILRWDMTHNIVDVTVEELGAKLFGEAVDHVEGGVDTFKLDEVTVNPFTDDVKLNVNVACARSGFLGVG